MTTSLNTANESSNSNINFRRSFRFKGFIGFIVILGLSISYLLTRMFNLTLLPPFVDEMVYSHWADQMQLINPLNVVTSGHGPLYPLLNLLVGKLANLDLILAGRLVSLIGGLITMLFLYKIGSKLWGIAAGTSTAILYIFSPFILTYNRMGLMEALQGLFMLAAFYFALLLAEIKSSWWKLILITLGLGFLLGAAMLIKLNSIIAVVWVGLALTFYGDIDLQSELSWKFWKFFQFDWLKWLCLIISCIIGLSIFSIQFAAPLYFGDNFDNFQFPLRDVIFSPGTTWGPRLLPYIQSTIGPYLTWPVTVIIALGSILSFIGLFLSYNKRLQQASLKAFILLIAGFIALSPTLFLLKFNAPRYLFSGLILFFPIAGWFLTEIAKGILSKIQPKLLNFNFLWVLDITLSCLVSLAAIPFMVNLITNPDTVSFPPQDNVQFLSGWPSGNELASFSSIVHEVTAENYPKTIQIVNIDANPGSNNYKMMLYLSLKPSPTGVTTPPNLEFKAIPFNSNLDYFNQPLFHYAQIRQDQITLVEIQASDEQRQHWSKNNPNFQLVAQYNKPNKVAYWLYKYNPPATVTNSPHTENLTGQGDLVAQLRLLSTNPTANTFSTQLKIQNLGTGKAANIKVSMPNSWYKLSFIDFAASDKVEITAWSDKTTQITISSLNPQETIHGSLVFEVISENQNISDFRFNLNWVDGKGPNQISQSNSLPVSSILRETSATGFKSDLLVNGSIQPLSTVTTIDQDGSTLTLEGAFYIPEEIVTYWITDKNGKSTALGKITADDSGRIKLKVDTKLLQPGIYTIAAYGNRSQVTGSYQLTR